MSTIRNTSADGELNALLILADGMSGGDGSAVITQQEAAGQRQLVNSDRLPTESGNSVEEYAAIGVILGPPDPADPLFRPATLPAGWKREATDHPMGSKVVDELGRPRISVFYKAAYYDRKASMYLETPYSYLRGVMWDGGEPILDAVWLTREVAIATLTDWEDSELKEAGERDELAASSKNEYWTTRAAELRESAGKVRAMRERIEAN